MKYVRSTTTGAILPYNEVLARRPNIQVLSPQECDDYDKATADLAKPKNKTAKTKVVEKKAKVNKPDKKMAVKDLSDPEKADEEIDAVVAALAID